MIYRIRGVKKVRARGHIYFYHRRTGERIKAEYGTDAFVQDVMRLNGQPLRQQARDGTLAGLIAAYRASPEFLNLTERTRKDYQRVFDYLAPAGDLVLTKLTSAGVIAARDRAFAKHKRRFANYVVQIFSTLCRWGKPRGWIGSNPAGDVPLIRRPRSLAPANRPWTSAELDTVLTRAPASIRLAVLLAACTGMREGDVIRFLWSGYDGSGIEFRQRKPGVPHWLPAHRQLREALDTTRETLDERRRRHAVVVLGERGRPFTSNGFQSRFFKFIRKLEKEGAVRSGLTFHGLRHTVGKMLAEAGCDTRTIAAVLGHATEEMARKYSEAEDRRRRVVGAIRKLERKKPRNGKH